MTAGQFGVGGSTGGFARWDIIAGAGDSVLFYMRSTALGHGWRIVDGVVTDTGPVDGLGKGWRIIAGGK